MSALLFLTAILASLIPHVCSTYTLPQGDPSGNPFLLPNATSYVQEESPYTIRWSPTTNGTVSIILLLHPTSDAADTLILYSIVEHIPNFGHYSWTPSTRLGTGRPGGNGTGYSLQLIVDATGQYQNSAVFNLAASDKPIPLSTVSAGAAADTTTPAVHTSLVATPAAPGTTVPVTSAHRPAVQSYSSTSSDVPTSSTANPSAPTNTGGAGSPRPWRGDPYGAVAMWTVTALAVMLRWL